ncbi:hypothetical protein Hanom_Chr01g00008901 [Helianthus anomalus]
MATKCKLQGPRCKKFEIWTKMAKVSKPQGPKWQFTLKFFRVEVEGGDYKFTLVPPWFKIAKKKKTSGGYNNLLNLFTC